MIELRFTGNTLTDDGAPRQGRRLAGIDAFAQLGKRADDPAPVGRMRCALCAGERGFEADWRLADAVLPQQLA